MLHATLSCNKPLAPGAVEHVRPGRASVPVAVAYHPAIPAETHVIDDELDILAWEGDVARHARTVIVPLANPDTATDLLRIARALLPAEGGRVIGLVVVLDDAGAERSRDTVAGLQDLVAVMADRLAGASVQLRTTSATSIARGILDGVRDTGADAVVLGVGPANGDGDDSGLGSIVESVVQAATCDVLIYRPAVEGGLPDVGRVVAAVDGDLPSRNALRVATYLQNSLSVECRIVHVRTDGVGTDLPPAVRRSVDQTLEGDRVDVEVVTDASIVDGLAGDLRPTDMLVLGFGHEKRTDTVTGGAIGRDLLQRLDGPVLTVARVGGSRTPLDDRIRAVLAWVHPQLTDVEQESIRSDGLRGAGATFDYVVMSTLSGLIATYGLLIDSGAVIIGAMLIAPLMTPIQSFGIALVSGRTSVALQALGTVFMGTGIVLVGAFLSGEAIGVAQPTAELLSRGSPTVIDAAVALVAGMAGAYATARKGIPAALAGVAIAAALVPPISAVGLALSAGRWRLAAGAGLLFTVNIACIAIVSAVVFQYLGLRAKERTRTDTGQRVLAIATVGAVVALLVVLVVVNARRVRVDERPFEDRLEATVPGVDVASVEVVRGTTNPAIVRILVDAPPLGDDERQDLYEVAQREVRRQLGESGTARIVIAEMLGGS